MRLERLTRLTVLACAPFLFGCPEEEGTLEKAGGQADEALEEAGDAVEDAADEVEDAMDDAADGTNG